MTIKVLHNGCFDDDTGFRCQMCYPDHGINDPRVVDRCKRCATSKKANGLLQYYWVRKYEYNLNLGKKVCIDKHLVMKRVNNQVG